jgi:hypothetical protein
MYNTSGHTNFFHSLVAIDFELAEKAQEAGCPVCDGVLDVSNYFRKPRGVEIGCPEDALRFSFCCRRDGCRRRLTPPSVRFLSRKVYVAMIVILSQTAYWGQVQLEICRQTRARWRKYWTEVLSKQGEFFKAKISQFVADFDLRPSTILEEFIRLQPALPHAWLKTLRFFLPLSTRARCKRCVSNARPMCLLPDGP